MSGKVNDAILQRLVAQGYTKSKATKALKECRNNEQQALALLKRELAPTPSGGGTGSMKTVTAAQQAQLQQSNEDRDDPFLGPTTSSTGSNQKTKKLTLFDKAEQQRGVGRGSGEVGTHPCVVRYGYCRYGKHCAFKDLPGNMCLNYLLGNCIYGDLCRSYHTLNGKDVRTVLGLKSDKEYLQLEDGSVVEISKVGKVHEGEIIGVIPKEDTNREQKIPQPADWSLHAASQPSHSDPLAPIPLASGGYYPPPSSPATLVAPAQSAPSVPGPSPFLEKLKAGLKEPQPAMGSSSTKQSAKAKDRLNFNGGPTGSASGSSSLNPSATPFFVGNLSKLKSAASGGASSASTPLTSLVSKRTEVDTATVFPRDPDNPWYGMPIPVHPCLVQKGSCLFGDHCLYTRVPGDICVYWLNGLCHFADEDCYWRHEEPPEDTLNEEGFMDLEMMAEEQLQDAHQQQWMTEAQEEYRQGQEGEGDPASNQDPRRSLADPATSFWGMNPEGIEGVDVTPGGSYRQTGGALPGLPGTKTAVDDAALLGPASTSSTGFSQGQLGVLGDVDQEKEERAFAAMRQVFPDTPPTTLIHCLRLANYDRRRVANFILQSESDNLSSEDMEAKFLAENLQEEKLLSRPASVPNVVSTPPYAVAAPVKGSGVCHAPEVPPTSSSSEGSPLAQAVAKSLKVVLLCQLFPTLEPSTVEAALQSTSYKFGDAFTLLEGSHELKILSDKGNSWRTDLSSALSGGPPLPNGSTSPSSPGLTMAEKLLLETLGKQFPQLPAPVIRTAFFENGKDMNKTVSALTPVNNDQMELRDQEGADGKKGQGKGRMDPSKEKPRPPVTQRNTTSMTVTSSSSSSNQDSELYRQAAEELDAHGDWRRTREEAYLTNDVRIRCLQLATAAYQRGDGRLAKVLSQRAYEYGQEYYRLNTLAMKALEEEQSVHGTSTLDLHGFHVEEALEVLSRRVRLCQQRHITRLRVIVGEGNHSRGGKGRGLIFPALLESLRTRGTNLNRCCTIISIRTAMLFLKIHLEENWR